MSDPNYWVPPAWEASARLELIVDVCAAGSALVLNPPSERGCFALVPHTVAESDEFSTSVGFISLLTCGLESCCLWIWSHYLAAARIYVIPGVAAAPARFWEVGAALCGTVSLWTIGSAVAAWRPCGPPFALHWSRLQHWPQPSVLPWARSVSLPTSFLAPLPAHSDAADRSHWCQSLPCLWADGWTEFAEWWAAPASCERIMTSTWLRRLYFSRAMRPLGFWLGCYSCC